jgi:hypothetical protein
MISIFVRASMPVFGHRVYCGAGATHRAIAAQPSSRTV